MTIHHRGPSIVAWAPAKLNLFFEVRARRDDGFHEIETLMAPISLYDTLRLRETPGREIEFRCAPAAGFDSSSNAWRDVPRDAENLVVQAVELLRQRAGCERGASIELIKRIPSAAGLGGGSSDAAAALAAANVLWQLDWSVPRLASLAAELGSDIPFFVHLMSGTRFSAATCRGRGECVAPAAAMAPLHCVLVRPAGGLSTAEVYRNCRVADQPREAAPLVAALQAGAISQAARLLYNALEPAAAILSDSVGRLREEFERLDFLGHQLTGSGTSYFGLCRHRRHARQLAARLRSRQLGSVYVVQTAN